jgi:hypothetical protein
MSLVQNRKKNGSGGAEGFRIRLVVEQGLNVVLHLLGRFEVTLVHVIVFVFATVGVVLSTNLWACFVNTATMVRLQVFANCMHQDVPSAIVDEYRCPIVQQEPANEVVIALFGRCFHRQRKVTTTFGRAVIA